MGMKLSDNGANFIASHEGGFRLSWYKLNDGMMTVGAGHTIPLAEAKRKGIKVGDKITKTQAIKWFEQDCSGFVNGTNRLLNQFGFKVNQNQFDALVSYAYNRGLGSARYDNGLYQLLHHSKSVNDISKNLLVYWGTNTYYTTNPGKVKLLASCNLYTSVEFNDKTKSGLSYPKGTVFTVNGIKKSKNGVPRLIVSNGKFVLTANKEYVKKV
ncbi:DUF5776 domain-containing protein [uncultured Rummeliibacillus sp.]|uniref:DUF5776 domain-containing protein n=1 Tax=uncultured Rummeliibacillus sp. TaxID=762292 RepID=UPI002609B613|nr:DUF5776 domain-containing protein [uncultured Rummeliibacillus sp.]